VERARIHVLDEATIAQIAAGEVIERPVSVVKELVENSLDAGARHIGIELVDGGRTAISVADDGSGIEREDLPLAIARHATSKLSAAGDLFSIESLGFRGEGLASIAAAGSVELTSRPGSATLGARIEARGTVVGTAVAAPSPPGTKVVVRDLFSLTPARREFLKSAKAESARVSAFLTQLSLGWPGVGFSLRHDGRDIWTLPPVSDPIDRLESVFGAQARGALLAVDTSDDARRERASGYICRPGRDRPNRNGQVFFVNGRLVRSAALSAAWLAGYGSFGMTGRYPFGVISLTLPPQDVDVNVHPTKIEVRFAFPQAVFDAVRQAVARTLRGTEPVRVFAIASPDGRSIAPLTIDSLSADDRQVAAAQISFAPERAPSATRALGQIDRTYILIATQEKIVVVDQHAAHERIAYEALTAAGTHADVDAPLLFPTVVELTPALASAYHEHEADLATAGFAIEPFGESAVRIRSLPAGYEARRFDLEGILEDLAADDATREGVARRNRVLATIACHSVVRAGEALSLQEQAALYERLLLCSDPHSCPHGRPTMLQLDGGALAKAFKRA
jgi:DNA mismatch repair protein MutL